MDEKCRNAKRLKYSIDVTFVVRRGARKHSFANHGCDISPLVAVCTRAACNFKVSDAMTQNI